MKRHNPHLFLAQPFHVVEPRSYARQVPDAIVVGVGEAADVDLIEGSPSPPWSRHLDATENNASPHPDARFARVRPPHKWGGLAQRCDHVRKYVGGQVARGISSV